MVPIGIHAECLDRFTLPHSGTVRSVTRPPRAKRPPHAVLSRYLLRLALGELRERWAPLWPLAVEMASCTIKRALGCVLEYPHSRECLAVVCTLQASASGRSPGAPGDRAARPRGGDNADCVLHGRVGAPAQLPVSGLGRDTPNCGGRCTMRRDSARHRRAVNSSCCSGPAGQRTAHSA